MSDSRTVRKLAKGGLLMTIGAFASKAIMYLYRLLVAQELGTEGYGMISLGLGVFWMLTKITSLGVGGGLNRKISNFIGTGEEHRIPSILQASLIVTLPLSLVVSIAVFFSSELIATQIFNNANAAISIKIFALAVPFQVLYNNVSSLVKAFKKMKYISLTDRIIRSVFTLVATVLALSLGYGLFGVLVVQLMAAAVAAGFMIYFGQFKTFSFFEKSSGLVKEGKNLFKYSYPLFLGGVVGLAMSWTDTMMLGALGTVSAVGVYNAAYPTSQLLRIVSNGLGETLFPQVSQKYGEGNKEGSVELASTALKWIFTTTFPGVVMMVLFSDEIIRLLFGNAFAGGATALGLLGTAYFIQSMTIGGTFIKSEDRTKISFYNSLGAAMLNIALNLMLIPMYGTTGAALATSISLTGISIVGMIEIYYLFDIQPYRIKDYVPSIAATTVSASIVYFGLHYIFETVPKLAMIPAAAAFGILYPTSFILLGGLDEKDKMVIEAIENKTDLELTKYLEKLENYSLL